MVTETLHNSSRPSSITYPGGATNSFVYNGLDTRVGKTNSSGSNIYLRDGASVTAPVLSDGSATYTPGISESRSGVSRFYGHDRLGSNNLQETSASTVAYQASYDAFGLVKSSSGSTASPFGFVGAEGYQTDNDSGLMLLGHRYYDPEIGRFLTRDPAKSGNNWYDYVGNNPTGGNDPSGLSQSPWEGPGIGAAIAIGIKILTNIFSHHHHKPKPKPTKPIYVPPGTPNPPQPPPGWGTHGVPGGGGTWYLPPGWSLGNSGGTYTPVPPPSPPEPPKSSGGPAADNPGAVSGPDSTGGLGG